MSGRSLLTRLAFAISFLVVPVCSALLAAETWVYPLDVTAGEEATFYIADRKLPGVWKLAEGKLTVAAQGEKTFRTPLNAVRCVAWSAETGLLAGDSATREVYHVADDGTLTPLTEGKVGIPTQLAIDGSTVYATDLETQRVWKFPAEGGAVEEVAVLPGPRGIAVDAEHRLWILSAQSPQLRRIEADGAETVIVEGPVFEFPHQVVMGADGTAYVSDGYAQCIWKIAPEAEPKKWVSGEPFDNPVGLTLRNDNLFVIDPRAGQLFRVAADGTVTPEEVTP